MPRKKGELRYCERCGAEFVRNERYESFAVHPRDGKPFRLVGVATLRTGRLKDTEIDLCDDCLEDFFNWFKEMEDLRT